VIQQASSTRGQIARTAQWRPSVQPSPAGDQISSPAGIFNRRRIPHHGDVGVDRRAKRLVVARTYHTRVEGVWLCHKEIGARDGALPVELSVVHGREASGTVVGVGVDVIKVAPGTWWSCRSSVVASVHSRPRAMGGPHSAGSRSKLSTRCSGRMVRSTS
jgi:hypothetical protein